MAYSPTMISSTAVLLTPQKPGLIICYCWLPVIVLMSCNCFNLLTNLILLLLTFNGWITRTLQVVCWNKSIFSTINCQHICSFLLSDQGPGGKELTYFVNYSINYEFADCWQFSPSCSVRPIYSYLSILTLGITLQHVTTLFEHGLSNTALIALLMLDLRLHHYSNCFSSICVRNGICVCRLLSVPTCPNSYFFSLYAFL